MSLKNTLCMHKMHIKYVYIHEYVHIYAHRYIQINIHTHLFGSKGQD
jgi:hypothetical protein